MAYQTLASVAGAPHDAFSCASPASVVASEVSIVSEKPMDTFVAPANVSFDGAAANTTAGDAAMMRAATMATGRCRVDPRMETSLPRCGPNARTCAARRRLEDAGPARLLPGPGGYGGHSPAGAHDNGESPWR